jgi:hypothetical protein
MLCVIGLFNGCTIWLLCSNTKILVADRCMATLKALHFVLDNMMYFSGTKGSLNLVVAELHS